MRQNVSDPSETMWVLQLTSDFQAHFENAFVHYDGQGGDVSWAHLDGQPATSLPDQAFHEVTAGDLDPLSGSSASDSLPTKELSNDTIYTSPFITPTSLPDEQSYQTTGCQAESGFGSTDGLQEAFPAL